MHKEVLSKYDIITVAENVGISGDEALDFVDPDRHELDMMYHFEGVDMGYVPGKFKTPDPAGYSLTAFKNMYSRWDHVFEKKGWGTIYLGNHDQPRMVTRWGNDGPEWRALSSKMLTTFLLSMRATPFYYQGDELGMTNIKFDKIADYRDIESINMYRQIKNNGGDLNEFIEAQKITARDNGRTPFQWDNSMNAGFSNGEPWLTINPNYETVNVTAEENDPYSCLHYFRKMINLRKKNMVLIYGDYHLLDKDNPDTYSYTRTMDEKKMLVMLNFTDRMASANPGIDLSKAIIACGNYPDPPGDGQLRPYEAVIYDLSC
jgi:oligo-1,6-glucosidase